jgi:hypothetical protein
MARKRGGLAGLYDRNKKYFKTLAPIALGAIPGVGMPLAVAAGAAMGGDREGKGYFKGFDVGGAVKGAAAGYGQGATGAGVRGLLTGAAKSGMTAGQGFKQAMKEYNRPASNLLNRLTGSDPMSSASRMIDSANQQILSNPAMGGTGVSVPNAPAPKSMLSLLRENKDLIGAGVKGLQMALPDRANEAAMMNAETARQRLDIERMEMERQRKDEEERRRRIRDLLLPYARQQFPTYFGGQ